MNFQAVEFEAATGRADQLKRSELPEIVFSGKSNVGKSSLINKLVNRKPLARVSATPGKTATINFFRLPDCRLVDLPGYGYAKVSQSEKQRWAKLMQGYFDGERRIALVVQILDMRHASTADDFDMINFLIERDLPFLAVCTKCDKLNKTQFNAQVKYFTELFEEHEIPFIPFSSQTGFGLDELKARIEAAVGECGEG
ncbi:MAG: ribosome biogenesis GTP-binding protein YihA/YsxC [Acutalibacteraceae bacterium]|nr:ribosome biogenesis GTP-binding protein YihA/YsxC [Acutalibacteraceae bacterium]